MAAKLKKSFDDLVGEVETRKSRERELQESEARLRASEERWRLVFENSTLGIMLTDHNHRFLATNRALQTMIGYTAQELQKLSPVDLIAEEEREEARRRLAELRTGERANYEVVTRYRRKDGSPIWVNTFVSTIPGGENSPPIYIATAIDITDRHKAESELRRYRHLSRRSREAQSHRLLGQEYQDRRAVLVPGGMAHLRPPPGNDAAVLSGLSRSGSSGRSRRARGGQPAGGAEQRAL